MAQDRNLVPAKELAARNGARFPNESAEYRRARDALLAEEIELRRHIERVAEQRRRLPPGGEVSQDYRFEGEGGPMNFAGLFGDRQTLVVYSYMYGPQRKRPCPMCTSLMSAWDGEARDIEQQVAANVRAALPDVTVAVHGRDVTVGGIQAERDHASTFGNDHALFAGLLDGIIHQQGVGIGRPHQPAQNVPMKEHVGIHDHQDVA